MTVNIQEITHASTSYIAEHNANYQNLKTAVESLQQAIGGAQSDPNASLPAAYKALFSEQNSLVGADSYVPSQLSAHNLSVTSGYAFVLSVDSVVLKSSATTISFSGQTTGTHYIHVDSLGEPSRDQISDGALYSVYYDSSSGDLTSVTRVGNLAWAYKDWEAAQVNLWNITYDKLDDRLHSIEGSAYGVLNKTITAANVTLTTAEALEQSVIQLLDGPQTADVDLYLPAEARVYQVLNNCSASYNVNIGVSGQTLYPITGNHFAIIYCDGTNVTTMFDLDRAAGGGSPASKYSDLTDTPSSHATLAGAMVKVKEDETGHEYFFSSYKPPVVAATTADLVSLSGLLTVDNVVLSDGDRVLVKDQTTPAENGIYKANASTWSRSGDCDLWGSLISAQVAVREGDTQADSTWYCPVNDGGTLDTTDITWQNMTPSVAYTDLSDGPSAYAGSGGYSLKVNATEDGVEFVADPYFAGGFYPGAPTDAAVALVHVLAVEAVFPVNLTGSQGTAEVAATAQADFDIQQDGSSVGTMRFAAAATTATFIFASEITFAIGDKLKIIAPGTADATLADISYSLKGTR